MSKCPFSLEQLETGEKTKVLLSEENDKSKPRHSVGCTPHECHGALMEKNGFGQVTNEFSPSASETLKDASAFLKQFADETNKYNPVQLMARIEQVKRDIEVTGTYEQTFAELEYGCRLA